jgi:hypothetical protein
MARKFWNWELKEWPHFSFNKQALEALEYQFSEKKRYRAGYIKTR